MSPIDADTTPCNLRRFPPGGMCVHRGPARLWPHVVAAVLLALASGGLGVAVCEAMHRSGARDLKPETGNLSFSEARP